MGCCQPTETPCITILILGTACVGKTTFFKQLKILHLDGFNEEEAAHYKRIIFSNLIGGISDLLEKAGERGLELKKYELEISLFKDTNEEPQFDQEFVQAAKTLWNAKELQPLLSDPHFKAALDESNLEYFMSTIDTLAKPDYRPSNDDIVRCRQRTVGYSQLDLEFQYQKDIVKVIDLGGHANERKKWDLLVPQAEAVLFLASLTHYDMPDPYNPQQTKLQESLQVFQELVNNPLYKDCGLLLFLTKFDLFKQQIKDGAKFSDYFDNYNGRDRNPADCAKFIKSQYLSLLPKNRQCFVHFTTTIDTNTMQDVINDVLSGLLRRNLADMGLYHM